MKLLTDSVLKFLCSQVFDLVRYEKRATLPTLRQKLSYNKRTKEKNSTTHLSYEDLKESSDPTEIA